MLTQSPQGSVENTQSAESFKVSESLTDDQTRNFKALYNALVAVEHTMSK